MKACFIYASDCKFFPDLFCYVYYLKATKLQLQQLCEIFDAIYGSVVIISILVSYL